MLDSRHIIGPGFLAIVMPMPNVLATMEQPFGDRIPAIGKVDGKTNCI